MTSKPSRMQPLFQGGEAALFDAQQTRNRRGANILSEETRTDQRMHPRQRQELRSAIRKMLYYLQQMDEPRAKWADMVEGKVNIETPPTLTDAQYFAFKAEVRELIEEMVADKR